MIDEMIGNCFFPSEAEPQTDQKRLKPQTTLISQILDF